MIKSMLYFFLIQNWKKQVSIALIDSFIKIKLFMIIILKSKPIIFWFQIYWISKCTLKFYIR